MSETQKNDFIRAIVKDDLQNGRCDKVLTRFPPEPNGFLHIGHVKSICLNFGVAAEFAGACNLRFDDTNPTAEKQDFVDNIKNDVRWLGFEWQGKARYASDYFEQLYQWAIQLIEQGDAYVDLQTPEQIKLHRGSFAQAGVDSPYRNADPKTNLDRFLAMKNGAYDEGEAVLRAKIDMAHPNMNMRDPILYRVMRAHHHQTGDAWRIYPMYDYAHPLSDAIEGITHSLCTLEFEDHRAFYDWVIQKIGFANPPRQYEFSRLNIDRVLTSKRKLKRLVDKGAVTGWDDPRMPTIAGMRRRGYTPEGLRDFCDRIGVSKADGVVDFRMLEFCQRTVLENTAARAMAVLRPLKVRIVNFAEAVAKAHELKKPSVEAALEDGVLWISQPKYHAHPDPALAAQKRRIPFSECIYIDKNDFALDPPPDYKRLSPTNREIRLRNSYVLCAQEWIVDENGEVVELVATVDPTTLGNNPEGRKVKGVIHWVSASCGAPATLRAYDRLLLDEPLPETAPIDGEDEDDVWLRRHLNPHSVRVYNAVVEPSLRQAKVGDRFQFERESYYILDEDSQGDALVFNAIVDLKDGFKPK